MVITSDFVFIRPQKTGGVSFETYLRKYYNGVRFGHLHNEVGADFDFDKWNHMTMFSEPWNGNANRFDSYIIHYAGKGVFDKTSRMEQIKSDKDIIYG
jgi:hypothetical protein